MSAAGGILQIIGGLASADLSVREGKFQEGELKNRARQEKLAGKDREIRRKSEMLDELARRRALQGAGVGTTAPSNRVVEDGMEDIAANNALTSARVSSLVRSAKATRTRGNMGAITGLTGAAGGAMGMGK